MKIEELLAELSAREIQLRRNADELVLRGPQETLDAALVGELRSHKGSLFSLMAGNGDDWWSPSVTITPEMLPLVDLTQKEIDEIVSRVPGGASNIQDIYPLTPLQEGILFHYLMSTEGAPYLVALRISFDTRARMEAYLEALRAVIERHDIFRTAVMWEALREPVQVVVRKADFRVEELQLEASAGGMGIEDQLYARLDPRRYRVDVREAPLLRVFLAEDRGKSRWFLLLLLHHLIDDNTSLTRMQEEIQAHLLGQFEQLPAPQRFRNLVAEARSGVGKEEQAAKPLRC